MTQPPNNLTAIDRSDSQRQLSTADGWVDELNITFTQGRV